MRHSLTTGFLLSALPLTFGLALPQIRSSAATLTTSNAFTLVANVTSGSVLASYAAGPGSRAHNSSINVQNFVVTLLESDANQCLDDLILRDPSVAATYPPTVFYGNATPAGPVTLTNIDGLAHPLHSSSLTSTSSSLFNPDVNVTCTAGTPWTAILTDGSRDPPIAYLAGYYYACIPGAAQNYPGPIVYSRGAGEKTPAGCADIALLPQCVTGATTGVDSVTACWSNVTQALAAVAV